VEGDYPPYASGGLLPEEPAELQASVPPASHQTNSDPVDGINLADIVSPQSNSAVTFLLPSASEQHESAPSTAGAPHEEQIISPVMVNRDEKRVPSPSYSDRDEQQAPSPISDTIDEQPPAPPSTDPREEKIPHRGFQKVEPDGAVDHTAVGGVAGSEPSGAQPHKKSWGDRFSNLGQRAVAKIGSPSFLPQSIDKECEKAAQVLKAFCSKLKSV
jgi:hypothetical protein